MFGNWATGKVAMVTAPAITVRIAITIATMGRFMKNLNMVLVPFNETNLHEIDQLYRSKRDRKHAERSS
jgi:hypothetical protein